MFPWRLRRVLTYAVCSLLVAAFVDQAIPPCHFSLFRNPTINWTTQAYWWRAVAATILCKFGPDLWLFVVHGICQTRIALAQDQYHHPFSVPALGVVEASEFFFVNAPITFFFPWITGLPSVFLCVVAAWIAHESAVHLLATKQ